MTEGSDAMSGLTKSVWSDSDLDQMLWHDATVHAIALHAEGPPGNFVSRLLMDLDYIVAWPPAESQLCTPFLVAPATLVFDDVCDIDGQISSPSPNLTIDRVIRSPGDGPLARLARWHIEGHEFALKFRALGYRLYLRQPPTLIDRQDLSLAERGGFAFTEVGYELSV
ncbi:hypothetical protein [Mycobacterium sp. shizuoka-1]|uniref:hypothetical protein n=1 Tax=Mycobacterium sp. shizuoka-1 TaxID=2039281 RepID=UPI000C0793B5|nr:hypothetical protein [Mycobacterium sp. shizuoka-1]